MFKKLINKYFLTIFLALILIGGDGWGGEKIISKKWCKENGGRAEVVFDDRTRCDCVTGKYAIEFEYAKKWYQAVGQSLHYAIKSGKAPGIILILKNNGDLEYLRSLEATVSYYKLPIKIWKMEQK